MNLRRAISRTIGFARMKSTLQRNRLMPNRTSFSPSTSTLIKTVAGASLAMGLFAIGCKSPAPPETPATTAQPAAEKIGGSDVVKLQRKATGDGSKPEFLSATILPGRGMNLFQVTANIPGKGETPLFFDLPDQFTTGIDDSVGNRSFMGGGAFLVPYPNRIRGKLSPDGKTLTTEWNGKTITLPANF
jgi:aldose 1-epimerase